LVTTPNMPEAYFLESFIGGLKPEMKPLVRAFKSQNLESAIEQARFQEEHVQALKLPPDKPFRPSLNSNSKPLLRTPISNYRTPQNFPNTSRAPQNNLSLPKTPSQTQLKSTRFIPAAERVEKMVKGLCFLCD